MSITCCTPPFGDGFPLAGDALVSGDSDMVGLGRLTSFTGLGDELNEYCTIPLLLNSTEKSRAGDCFAFLVAGDTLVLADFEVATSSSKSSLLEPAALLEAEVAALVFRGILIHYD